MKNKNSNLDTRGKNQSKSKADRGNRRRHARTQTLVTRENHQQQHAGQRRLREGFSNLYKCARGERIYNSTLHRRIHARTRWYIYTNIYTHTFTHKFIHKYTQTWTYGPILYWDRSKIQLVQQERGELNNRLRSLKRGRARTAVAVSVSVYRTRRPRTMSCFSLLLLLTFFSPFPHQY